LPAEFVKDAVPGSIMEILQTMGNGSVATVRCLAEGEKGAGLQNKGENMNRDHPQSEVENEKTILSR